MTLLASPAQPLSLSDVGVRAALVTLLASCLLTAVYISTLYGEKHFGVSSPIWALISVALGIAVAMEAVLLVFLLLGKRWIAALLIIAALGLPVGGFLLRHEICKTIDIGRFHLFKNFYLNALAQPKAKHGGLKIIPWGAWANSGGTYGDSSLVFDETDSLEVPGSASAITLYEARKAQAIAVEPCKITSLRRVSGSIYLVDGAC